MTRAGRSDARQRRHDGVVTAIAGISFVLVVAGCGSPPGAPAVGSTASSGAAASGSASAAAAAPDPNAPEVVSAGDIPDNQVFVPVIPSGARFTVSVPQGWAQTGDGGAAVFTDKFNSVRIETVSRATAPDTASVRTQDVAMLQSTPGFAFGDVREVERTAGPGVLVTYSASSPLNAVTGKSVTEAVERYVFWRGGQEAILTLSGPQGSDNVDPWRTITDSLRWLP